MAMLVSDSLLSILPWLTNSAGEYIASQTSEISARATTRVGLWLEIALMILRQPNYRLLRLVIWLITAAYLYQFESAFKQHLITNSALGNSDR